MSEMSGYHGWVFGIGSGVVVAVFLYWVYKLRQTKRIRDSEIQNFHRRFTVDYYR